MASAAVAVAVATSLAPARPAAASGITTHAWMALEAIPLVQDPRLETLLAANADQVRGGAQFPDGGYWPGNVYGEEAHWQRFHDAYADQILARDDCGDLTDPDGPCAPEIAHLMGAIAHGIGDQAWDWLFEPQSPDRGEYYLPPEWSPIAGPGGQELQMDLVAIADHDQPLDPIPDVPDQADILAAFDAVGFVGATPASLATGLGGLNLIKLAEANLAAQHIDLLRAAMPWLSANVVTAPGGVEFSAVAIAGAMDSMWGRLLGDQPPTEVSITYPADGERRIPAGGWVRSYIAGSNPGSGGARTRIAAALTSARPYVPLASGPGSVPAQLPPGAMTLTEVATGAPVPVMTGYPRSVPYTPDAGEHLVDIQPAVDLAPCSWYEAAITGALVDARGLPVEATSWRFRTGADAAGSRCVDDPLLPGDPVPAGAGFVAAVHRDVLGRDADPAELGSWLGVLADGGRLAVARGILDSVEHRRQLATDAYDAILHRAPTGAELDEATAALEGGTLAKLVIRLFSTHEAYRVAGRTGDAFVTAVHRTLLGHEPTPAELDEQAGQLVDRAGRRAYVTSIVRSDEAAALAVDDAFGRLLRRAPTAAERADASLLVAQERDSRRLWAEVLATDAYFDAAEAG